MTMANGNANAFRVLICGHSHVYWLKKEWQNFEKACPLTQATVSFLAVRGAKVAQFETKIMLDRIKRGRYDIVIFHLGGKRPGQRNTAASHWHATLHAVQTSGSVGGKASGNGAGGKEAKVATNFAGRRVKKGLRNQ